MVFGLPVTLPQLAMGLIGANAVVRNCFNLADPTVFMARFKIEDRAAARVIAFLLVLVNSYDVMGAVQDNWAVYGFAAASRVAAAGLFWRLGPAWMPLVRLELGTLAPLVVAMLVGR